MIQRLVDSYQCEWAAVVNDPEKRKRFQQFMNTEENEPCIEFVSQRGQSRPADWPGELVSLQQFQSMSKPRRRRLRPKSWRGCRSGRSTTSQSTAARRSDTARSQIAVFNFASRGEWYASQNMCPHKKAFVLSRGILGDQKGGAEGCVSASQEDVCSRRASLFRIPITT